MESERNNCHNPGILYDPILLAEFQRHGSKFFSLLSEYPVPRVLEDM